MTTSRTDGFDDSHWLELAARLRPRSRLIDRYELAGGLSSFMTVLELERADGIRDRFVVRRDRDADGETRSLDLGTEYRLLEQLRRHDLPTPAPVLFDDSEAIIPRPIAVYEYIEGAPTWVASDAERVGRDLADWLVHIHRLGPAEVAAVGLSNRADVVDASLERVPAAVDERLRELEVRDVLTAHRHVLLSDVQCLLHGDYWPGNVLWDGDSSEVVGIIDWEDASIGDPLADVGTTRLDLLWAFGPAVMHAFTERYLDGGAVDSTTLPIWDLVAALRPAGQLSVWAADWASFGRPGVTTASMAASHGWFLDRALAAIG